MHLSLSAAHCLYITQQRNTQHMISKHFINMRVYGAVRQMDLTFNSDIV